MCNFTLAPQLLGTIFDQGLMHTGTNLQLRVHRYTGTRHPGQRRDRCAFNRVWVKTKHPDKDEYAPAFGATCSLTK